jgi:hypothetical protein
MIRGTEIQMMMWIEVLYVVASFVVRNPNIVLGGRCRPFVQLKVFAQRVMRRIEPARYEGGETRDRTSDSAKGFVNSGVSRIRKVDRDSLRF